MMNFATEKRFTKNFMALGIFSLFIKIAFVMILAHTATAQARPAPESFADLAERLLPTVVNISTTQKVEEEPIQQNPFQMSPMMPGLPENHPFHDMFNDLFDRHFQMMPPMRRQQIPMTSLGSGFIIDSKKGLIITNNHVIMDADEIQVTLHNDNTVPAKVLGTDDKTDLALIQADLSGEKVAEAKFGNSDKMRVGDWVVAIGNPFGLGGTVTAGIISARQRDINSGPYDDYLQTDASINRGNSGGPMFNMDGEVIGINTAIFSPTGGSVGIGFAIPSELAEPVINQIQEYGRTRRGWLGVKIQDVTDEIAESLGLAKAAGALVAEVTPEGPAQQAGIEAGDIILAFDNKPVREMRNLPRIVAETDINKTVPVIVWRDGKRITLNANIGELEKAEEEGLLAAHEGDNIFDNSEEKTTEGTTLDELGMTVKPLNNQTRDLFGIDKNAKGLVVMDTDPNSDAAKKGIDAGDVIVDINQKPATIELLQTEIKNAKDKGRNSILFLINRQGAIQFVAVKLSSDDTEE